MALTPVRPGDIYYIQENGSIVVLLLVVEDVSILEQKQDSEFVCFLLWNSSYSFMQWDELPFVDQNKQTRAYIIEDVQKPLPKTFIGEEITSLNAEDYTSPNPEFPEGGPEAFEISYHHFYLRQPDFGFEEVAIRVNSLPEYLALLEEMTKDTRFKSHEIEILKEIIPLFPKTFGITSPPRLSL